MTEARDHMWDPDIQTLPRADLLALQQKRLDEVVARTWERPVPFFARKLEAGGFDPGDGVTLAELGRVPVTVKDELRTSEAAAPPFGDYRGARLRDCVRVGATGGTSGVPTFVLSTKRDIANEQTAAARMFWRQGLRPGMVLANAHPLGVYGGGMSLTTAMESFGCLVLAVGELESDTAVERAIDLWRRCRPMAYQIFPATYVKVFEAAVRMGIDPVADLNLHPPMEHPDAAERTITAGSEGFAFLGSACPEGGGAHAAEDFAIVEAVDTAGRAVPDGEVGELVVTTIDRDNFLIRYNVEDYVVVNPDPCACGETSRRVKWQGRKKDVVSVGGTAILPSQVARVIFGGEAFRTPTMEYQIVRRGLEMEALELRVEYDAAAFGDPSKAARGLESAIGDDLGVPARVELVARGALPRPPYKPERVVDES
ncbi:MAG: hypothetical protein IT198_04240 [Acidimicrobiia bacterium]|nr:hypothetical protein [Acidimicrobiia bacterium]